MFTKYVEYRLFRKIKANTMMLSAKPLFGCVALEEKLKIFGMLFKSIYALSAKNPTSLNHLCFFAINQSGQLLYLLGAEVIEEY